MKKLESSQKEIAQFLGRSPATISRELKRNQGLRGYRPVQAQRLSEIRHSEAHKAIKVTEKVKGWMEILIRQELRPQKVVGYLTRNKGLSLHHETVYQLVYTVKANGGRFIYAPSGCLQDL